MESVHGAEASSAVQKCGRRLLPLLTLCYLGGQIDRSNVAFAAKGGMLSSLHMHRDQYGLGSGLFSIGYVSMQLPGNLIQERVGSSLWLGTTVIATGLVAASTAAVSTSGTFYAARLVLGLVEAGFAPGAILFFTRWFPAEERARILSLFFLAAPIAGVVSSPWCGAVLDVMGGVWGLAGWQWIFLLQGIPVCVLGGLLWVFLPNTPAEAWWLNQSEKEALVRTLVQENDEREGDDDGDAKGDGASLRRNAQKCETEANSSSPSVGDQCSSILQPHILLLGGIIFVSVMCAYGVNLWLPLTVSGLFPRASSTVVGLVTGIPYVASLCTMIIVGHYVGPFVTSHGELILGSMLVTAGTGLILSGLIHNSIVSMVMLVMAMAANSAASVVFFAWVTTQLSSIQHAPGIAVVNSLGHLGGFVGPYIGCLAEDAAVGLIMIGVPTVLVGVGLLLWYTTRSRVRPENFDAEQQHRLLGRLATAHSTSAPVGHSNEPGI